MIVLHSYMTLNEFMFIIKNDYKYCKIKKLSSWKIIIKITSLRSQKFNLICSLTNLKCILDKQ